MSHIVLKVTFFNKNCVFESILKKSEITYRCHGAKTDPTTDMPLTGRLNRLED